MLRQVLNGVVFIIAVYGFVICIAPFASQFRLSIPDKVWIYRRCDYFSAIPAFLSGMLFLNPMKQLRLVPLITLPLIWILLVNARGPWVAPGTFDKYTSSVWPVVIAALLATIGGILFQLLLQKINFFRGIANSLWLTYVLVGASLVMIVLAESLTPMESRRPLSLHIWVAGAACVSALIAVLSPKLLGD
ncbi:MAG TPA: hypothetical protein DCQ94_14045 [Nitrospira sp.]|nr:hypothetical protein [Nitrospira sp.]